VGILIRPWAFAQQVRHLDTAVIADRMLNLGIRHIPVTRDGTVLGMVSMRDLLAFEMWAA
jgi:signal-transduction protein with cAMP-binding, CBS, and nucleotidyltransferase domain